MSANTEPISNARFVAAILDLDLQTLGLKVLEIQNSISHLRQSNEQLKPYAEGLLTPLATTDATATGGSAAATTTGPGTPDQDCIDAIRENEMVIARLEERILLARAVVAERGTIREESVSLMDAEGQGRQQQGNEAAGRTTAPQANGIGGDDESEKAHPAWTDGTFQIGTIRNGEVHTNEGPAAAGTGGSDGSGGRQTDEQLRRAMEEHTREPVRDEDDDDGGIHL